MWGLVAFGEEQPNKSYEIHVIAFAPGAPQRRLPLNEQQRKHRNAVIWILNYNISSVRPLRSNNCTVYTHQHQMYSIRSIN